MLTSALWFAPALAAATSTLVINEVCYDPPGADGGAEYVEIINPGIVDVSLAGCRLEFANGAVGLPWTGQWVADDSAVVPPGGVFLIVDTGWTGVPPDAVASFDLQNGPVAIRVVY